MQVLEETRRDIRKRLMAEAEALASITDWTRERLEAVDRWADEVLAGANAAMTSTLTTVSVTAATASLATYNAMLSFEGKAAAIQTVGMTVDQLRAWFRDTPLEGGTALSGWVDKAFSNGIKRELLASLQQSGIEGKGTAEAVRRLMDKAVAVGAAITQREAITLARTFIQTANVGAMTAVYQKNRHIITRVQWCTALDNRVCPRCAVLDGKTWGIDDARPPIPAHPRCRCVLLPRARSWRDFDITAQQLEAVARPWVVREAGPVGAGGRKILYAGTTRENFGGWWKTLPAKEQDAVLGPVRAKLVREGKIAWDDNVDATTGRLRTLAEVGYNWDGKLIYDEAKSGGFNSGFYNIQVVLPTKSVKKTVYSLQKQIDEHAGYIADPTKKVPDYNEHDKRYRDGLIVKWQCDIKRQRQQLDIAKGILKKRGEEYGEE